MVFINARFLTQRLTGTQRWAMGLTGEVTQLTQDVELVAPGGLPTGKMENTKISRHGRLAGHLWEQMELPACLKKRGSPLLVNLCNSAPLGYSPQIVTVLDLSFLRNPRWFSRGFYMYYRFLIPRIVRGAERVITISEFSKREMMELLCVPEEKIRVIYCGVPALKVDEKVPNRYGSYILTVSSLDPRKNIKNLILAYRRLSPEGIKLVVAGPRNDRVFRNGGIKGLSGDNGDIVFTGYVGDAELATLYRGALVFVYPSFYEGFGLPPLEAMAHGCPVVTSPVASLPEVCGKAAVYVDPHDVEDIRRGIQKVISDRGLREELRNMGMERVRLFSWKASAHKLLEVIKEVC